MRIQRSKAPGATVWCRVFGRIHRNSVPGDAIFLTFRLRSLFPLLLPALAQWCRVSDPHCATLRVSVEHSGTTCFYISASVKRLPRTSTVGRISCDGSQLASSLSRSVKQPTSHSTGTVPVMDNKDTKSTVDGVESEGAFSSDTSSVKGHTSAVGQALGQNEEFKADTHNVSSSSTEEGSSTDFSCSSSEEVVTQDGSSTDFSCSSSEEVVTSSLLSPLSSASEYKSHWGDDWPRDPSGAETGNEEESFRLVRRIHPSELRIMRRIAVGGQAKFFLVLFENKLVVVKRYNSLHVSVANLQSQMEMVMKACEGRSESGLCKVIGVSRDKKGRALLVMPRMRGDLWGLIHSKKLLLHSVTCDIMRGIARGLKTLHACGRIHKDVKPANILVNTRESEPIPIPPTGLEKLRWQGPLSDYVKDRWDLPLHLPRFDDAGREISYCTYTHVEVYIGDYDSVDEIIGTGFWRAPEVLKALRDGSPEDLELAFTPAVDVYGFGMVLYELLTGLTPFQGHPLNDYDLVISGHRPDIPDYVNPEMRDLLLRCWHEDPHHRPSWTEIEKLIEIILRSAP